MKKETILTISLVIAVLLVGVLNSTVLAAITLNIPGNTTTNTVNTANTVNSIEVVNTNTNTPGQLANTGLQDLPYLVITLLIISAIFAYKKIKEYKSF